MTRIVCISDTHGLHDRVVVPAGDILIHAGDCTSRGLPIDLVQFLRWFSALPHRHKVLIAGNHDWIFEKDREGAQALLRKHAPSVYYLNDSGAEIQQLKFWGSPVQPTFYDWAFNRQRGPEIRVHRDLIPADTDVLVTHGPPARILDLTPSGERAGCVDLRDALARRSRLRLSVFGHLHLQGGQREQHGKVTYVNAAICNEDYRPIHLPVIVDL